jgi:hypothetical protein
MASSRSALLAAGVIFSGLSCHGCHGSASPVPDALASDIRPGGPGIAVVELFTSEGCSSCPPAEAVFERIARRARDSGERVVPLSFHVDYWDGLGWPDRFSSPDFTERQRRYSRAFGDSGMYTPEMIVGGAAHFVGSDGARAESAIASAIARPVPVRLALQVVRKAPDTWLVHYDVVDGSAATEGATLWIGVVQRSATVHVGAGENAGRTLVHTDVVRAFVESPMHAATGEAVLRAPWVPMPHEADVVAFVQQGEGRDAMAILGADRVELP